MILFVAFQGFWGQGGLLEVQELRDQSEFVHIARASRYENVRDSS